VKHLDRAFTYTEIKIRYKYLTNKAHAYMQFAILQSVVGGPGPLIVEYNGQMFIENCLTITHKHVNSIHEKIKNIKNLKIEQTTDRSFIITE